MPYQEVRAAFERTAQSLGMEEIAYRAIGQCVWHLENRGISIIAEASVYLMLAARRIASSGVGSLRPRAHPTYGLSCVCPIYFAAKFATRLVPSDQGDGPLAAGGPGVALLALPMLYRLVNHDGPVPMAVGDPRRRAIRMRRGEGTILYGDGGTTFETGGPGDFGWVYDDDPPPTDISLIPDLERGNPAIEQPFRRLTELKLHKPLTAEGLLDLPFET
ncbi:MAG: hypothetical protein AAF366_17170 [Pseudomonadota bacterium]